MTNRTMAKPGVVWVRHHFLGDDTSEHAVLTNDLRFISPLLPWASLN
jgi:hypothetical protein